jgi:hypothetical protein
MHWNREDVENWTNSVKPAGGWLKSKENQATTTTTESNESKTETERDFPDLYECIAIVCRANQIVCGNDFSHSEM